jgi:predicted acylesterase/phospholipase RssA
MSDQLTRLAIALQGGGSHGVPQVYRAVEIGGEHYWDGGYTSNPALAPLYLGTDATDLIVVGINPSCAPSCRAPRAPSPTALARSASTPASWASWRRSPSSRS